MTMSGAEIALIITALATLVGSIGSLIVSVRSSRKLDVQSEKIEKLHESTNSLSERNEVIAKELGRIQGRSESTPEKRT